MNRLFKEKGLRIVLTLVIAISIPLLFKRLLRSDFPSAVLFPCVILLSGFSILRRFTGNRYLKIISYSLSVIFALTVIAGILIIPFSVYVAWVELLRAGEQRGAVSTVFLLIVSYLSALTVPMFLSWGYLWTVLILSLVITTLATIMLQNPILLLLLLVLYSLILCYLAFGDKAKIGKTGGFIYSFSVMGAVFLLTGLLTTRREPPRNQIVDYTLYPGLRQLVLRLFPGFPLLYGVPGYGFSVDHEELGRPPSLSSQIIFEAEGPPGKTLYLRTSIYDTYDGNSWENTLKNPGQYNFRGSSSTEPDKLQN
ncbi:MAG: hypothetical protein DRP87_17345 [Spirochaetes bacterium]|nr:MAG: hypothetical protein DRP87_17345 [Spirochaetota bacterium]